MSWTGWESLGAPPVGFVGAPAAHSRNPRVCNVYVQGTDNRLWQRAYVDGWWSDWMQHRDRLGAPPAAGSMGPDDEYVVMLDPGSNPVTIAPGSDPLVELSPRYNPLRTPRQNVSIKKWTKAGGWVTQKLIGFVARDTLATVCRDGSTCNLFARGASDYLYERAYASNPLGEWKQDPDSGSLEAAPAACAIGRDLETVVIARGGRLFQKWHLHTNGGGWSHWMDLGAPPEGLDGGAAIISRNPDVVNLYVRGKVSNKLWQKSFVGGVWGEWAAHDDGGVLHSAPAVMSMGADHEHVFVRGTDGAVWHKGWAPPTEPTGFRLHMYTPSHNPPKGYGREWYRGALPGLGRKLARPIATIKLPSSVHYSLALQKRGYLEGNYTPDENGVAPFILLAPGEGVSGAALKDISDTSPNALFLRGQVFSDDASPEYVDLEVTY